MSRGQHYSQYNSPSLIDGNLPVLVFPNNLTFYVDDQSSYKQVLTLYNPYEVPLKYKVLCTAPKKYVVLDSDGVVKPRCCIDILVRHTSVMLSNCHLVEKFRIQVQEHVSGISSDTAVLGRKDIIVTLLPTRPPESTSAYKRGEKFQQLSSLHGAESSGSDSTAPAGRPYSIGTQSRSDRQITSSPSPVIVIIAIVCFIALMLPTEGDELKQTGKNSLIPHYLYLTINQKLIAAYGLGLLTMVILKAGHSCNI
ncbi:MOSPD1 (predicted) [Pycnogonum litorale]